MSSRAITICVAVLSMLLASVASAATYNPRKIKKWPEEDKVFARMFDSWMTQEEMDIFVALETSEDRQEFLEEAGYWKMWEDVEDEMKPLVLEGDVLVGMSKDEVFMCWDKPKRIRKDFRKEAYVDVLNFEWERDRKGREFLLKPDSQTAYKNEVFTKFVYMYNGKVFSVVNEGEEENVMDDLPVEDKPAPPVFEPEEELEDDLTGD